MPASIRAEPNKKMASCKGLAKSIRIAAIILPNELTAVPIPTAPIDATTAQIVT